MTDFEIGLVHRVLVFARNTIEACISYPRITEENAGFVKILFKLDDICKECWQVVNDVERSKQR